MGINNCGRCRMDNKPTVLVLLSTYNGEQYLLEQIESIFQQKGVIPSIMVRDDGSSDGTIRLLEECENKFERISYSVGENIGYKASFMHLIYDSPSTYDYYALSDQDDVWIKDKLISAVDYLKEDSDIPALYYSYMTQVDEKLNKLDEQQPYHYPEPKPKILFQNFVQGSTIVFNRELLDKIKQYRLPDSSNIAQDIWLPIVATYFGKIFYDTKSHILYRRMNSSVTVVARKKYWGNLFRSVFQGDKVINPGKYLWLGYKDELSKEDLSVIEPLYHHRKLSNKFKLIRNKNVRKNTFKGTLMLEMSILFGRLD